MQELAANGIYTGIILTPVLPFITDNEENIEKVIMLSKEHGAKYVLGWMGMTQREGQREYYYKKLDACFPGIKKLYITHFGDNYNCSPSNSKKLYDVNSQICDKLDLPKQMELYKESKPEQLDLF